jgi:hypothetical protein
MWPTDTDIDGCVFKSFRLGEKTSAKSNQKSTVLKSIKNEASVITGKLAPITRTGSPWLSFRAIQDPGQRLPEVVVSGNKDSGHQQRRRQGPRGHGPEVPLGQEARQHFGAILAFLLLEASADNDNFQLSEYRSAKRAGFLSLFISF